ncbi:HNH endonuclease signature motif containing protein [Carnimonas bestiolae]|uniref:HNH endonuclease signature motif containing protein n=1 Tax=Carnimonas bestiolae TaxID=3402172 RepID=UPI003EDC7DFE
MNRPKPFRTDEINRLIEAFPNHTDDELVIMLDRPKPSIRGIAKRYGLKKSEDHLKRRGCRIKKDDKPKNIKPIGSVSYSHGHYIRVKTSDTGNYGKDWSFAHRVVWEHYYGAIPKGMCVSFVDGNSYNLNPENLVLKTKCEILAESGINSFPPDVAYLIRIRGVLTRIIRQKEKSLEK